MVKRGSAQWIGELLSGSEVADIAAIRDRAVGRTQKKGGVIDVDGTDAVATPLVKRVIKACAPNRQVVWTQFVDTPFPFVIHADTADGQNLGDVVIIIPLDSAPQPAAGTVFFRQHWTGPSANFVKGTPSYPGTVNQTITDYTGLERMSSTSFPADFRDQYLSHLQPQWLEGLSFDAMIPWTVGAAILFPCTQLHASASMAQGARKRSLIIRLR